MPRNLNNTDLADSTASKIIEAILQSPSPQVSVEALAESTELSVSTVQKRLSELFNEGRLSRAILVKDWTYAGYPFRYRVDIRANMRLLQLNQGGPPHEPNGIDSQRKLAAYIKDVLAQRFRSRLVVVDVTILLGQEYDLSVELRVKNPKSVFLFVTEGLRVLGGVDWTMTSQEAWSYGEPERE